MGRELPSMHRQEDQKFKASLGYMKLCLKRAGKGRLARMSKQSPYPRPLLRQKSFSHKDCGLGIGTQWVQVSVWA